MQGGGGVITGFYAKYYSGSIKRENVCRIGPNFVAQYFREFRDLTSDHENLVL